MDQFIQDINALIMISNEPVGKQPLIEHNVIEKQYIVYYLYRILCKYEQLFTTNLSYQMVRDIYKLLRIPEEKKKGCYPMSQKMTSNDELLNLILSSMVELFNQLNENLKMTMTNKYFMEFKEFLSKKPLERIIQDLMELHQLVPNLSAPIVKPYMYDKLALNIPNNKTTANTPVSGTTIANTPVTGTITANTPVAGTTIANTPVAGTIATNTPVAGTIATNTPVAGTIATNTPVASTTAATTL